MDDNSAVTDKALDQVKKVKMSVVDVEVQGFEQPLGQVLVSNGVSSRKEVIQWFNC
jgi:hypothetical protein